MHSSCKAKYQWKCQGVGSGRAQDDNQRMGKVIKRQWVYCGIVNPEEFR